jgi:hypothetical protein
VSPAAFASFSAKFNPATFAVNPAPPPAQIQLTNASVTPGAPQSVLVVNTGAAPLVTVGPVATSGVGCSEFNINGPASGTTLNECDTAPITVIYKGPTPAPTDTTVPAPAASQCTITLSTSAGSKSFTVTGSTQ